MLAYGKLDRNLMAKGYFQGCLGFEFSGTALGGRERRVMGVARRALATQVCAQDNLVSPLPDGLCLDCLRERQVTFADASVQGRSASRASAHDLERLPHCLQCMLQGLDANRDPACTLMYSPRCKKHEWSSFILGT